MKSVVIYASRYGNTRKVAEVIANTLQPHGEALLLDAFEATSKLPGDADLVIVGGPTEQHGMTEAITRSFAQLRPHAPVHIAAAAFDTRMRWPRWLSGSAASGISHKLRAADANVIVPEESFFVRRVAGAEVPEAAELEAGELQRVGEWAASLANKVAQRKTAADVTR